MRLVGIAPRHLTLSLAAQVSDQKEKWVGYGSPTPNCFNWSAYLA
jgi:hypothetical protein